VDSGGHPRAGDPEAAPSAHPKTAPTASRRHAGQQGRARVLASSHNRAQARGIRARLGRAAPADAQDVVLGAFGDGCSGVRIFSSHSRSPARSRRSHRRRGRGRTSSCRSGTAAWGAEVQSRCRAWRMAVDSRLEERRTYYTAATQRSSTYPARARTTLRRTSSRSTARLRAP
jgi:hypothetical protein